VSGRRSGGRTAGKLQKVRTCNRSRRAQAHISAECRPAEIRRAGKVIRSGKQAGQVFGILRVGAPVGRARHGTHQCSQRLGARLRPFSRHAQNLFRAVRPDGLFVGDDSARPGGHSSRVPGFADAVPVQLPGRERVCHQLRRQDRDLDIVVGIDPRRGKPIAQFVGVTRKRMDNPEAQRCSAICTTPCNRFREGQSGRGRIAVPVRAKLRHLLPECRRHGYRITAEPQDHRGQHGNGKTCQVQTRGNRHRREHMGNVKVTHSDPVTDIGPRGFAHKLERDPLFFSETDLLGRDKNRAVQKWNEACKYRCQLPHDDPPISDLAASPRQKF